MQFTNKQQMAVLFIGLGLFAMSSQPSDAYSVQDLQKLKATGSCQNCDLSGANLTGIDLSNADLTGANLSKANFTNVNLTNTKIVNADLRSSTFSGATVKNTNLYGTQFYLSYFTKEQQNGLIYQQPIAGQPQRTKPSQFPANQEIFNAYFNAGYGYCDAQMLGKFWNTDPAGAKLLAGKGLLRLSGFSTNISDKLTSARQQYSGQGICNYSSDFSYDDAVALASYWKVPISTAKTSLTGKLESGNLALAKQVVSEARRSAKKTNFPANQEIFNAYFNAGYGYCDAQMLGKFWNTDPAGAKLLAGKGLLRLPGFSTNISDKLTSARQQYSGQGICNYSSDFSYDDAVALASYWKVPIATAKTSLTGKLESGNLALAKDEVKKARRSAKKQRR